MPLLFYQVGTADNMNLFNTAVHWLASARPVEPRRPWYMDGIAVHRWHRCTWSLYMYDIANMENMEEPAHEMTGLLPERTCGNQFSRMPQKSSQLVRSGHLAA